MAIAMMNKVVVIEYADCPPSLNAVGSRGAHFAFHRAKRQWQAALEGLLMSKGKQVPRGASRVIATAVLRFPVSRRRDEGNYRALLEKALGDALVNGGWLADDTPEFFSFASLSFEDEPGPRRTKILLGVKT